MNSSITDGDVKDGGLSAPIRYVFVGFRSRLVSFVVLCAVFRFKSKIL